MPRLQELSAKQLQVDAYADPDIRAYLPEFSESRQVNREFLFNVSACLLPSLVRLDAASPSAHMDGGAWTLLMRRFHDILAQESNSSRQHSSPFYLLTCHSQIINTVKPDFFPDNIRGCMQHRQDMAAEKNNRVVDLVPEFYELIMNTLTSSRSKEPPSLPSITLNHLHL